MKPTKEQLENYSMLYSKIECVKLMHLSKLLTPISIGWYVGTMRIEYIQLRSIDSLTDEEVEKICDIEEITLKEYLLYYTTNLEPYKLETIDYLRSIGVATPYLGFSVEELKESGKLKV